MEPTRTTPTFMSRRQAADYLLAKWNIRMTEATLAKKASQGGGPPYRLDGRYPNYSDVGLDAFAKDRLGEEVTSTAVYRAAQLARGAAARKAAGARKQPLSKRDATPPPARANKQRKQQRAPRKRRAPAADRAAAR